MFNIDDTICKFDIIITNNMYKFNTYRISIHNGVNKLTIIINNNDRSIKLDTDNGIKNI